jgi:hypothetical protein
MLQRRPRRAFALLGEQVCKGVSKEELENRRKKELGGGSTESIENSGIKSHRLAIHQETEIGRGIDTPTVEPC